MNIKKNKQQIPYGPIALSLSGGGSKGAYTVGVLQYLYRGLGVTDVRIFYGTSTGALIAGLAAAGISQKNPRFIDEMIKIYGGVTTESVIENRFPIDLGDIGNLIAALAGGFSSVYGTDGLKNLIDTFISDEDWDNIIEAGQREESPIDVGFAVVDLQTGYGEIVTNIKYPDRQILKDALLASASMPIFMPPVKIKLNGEAHDYVDGGLLDYNPLEFIFSSPLIESTNSIISVNLDWLNREKSKKNYDKVGKVFTRTMDLLQHDVYWKDYTSAQLWNVLLSVREADEELFQKVLETIPDPLTEYVEDRQVSKKYIPILNIEPLGNLDIDSLDFDPKKMYKLLKRGAKDAAKLLEMEAV